MTRCSLCRVLLSCAALVSAAAVRTATEKFAAAVAARSGGELKHMVAERFVNMTIVRAASSLTDCLLTQHEPVIVTLSDVGYVDLLYLWAERAAQMGWPQRVVVALDKSTYTSETADVSTKRTFS